MNLTESVQKSLQPLSSLDKKMDRDQKEAAELVTSFQKAGHKVRKVEVDPSPASRTSGEPRPAKSEL